VRVVRILIQISRPETLTSIKVLPLGWRVESRRSGEHQKAKPDPQALRYEELGI